jgi:hypothetical protein
MHLVIHTHREREIHMVIHTHIHIAIHTHRHTHGPRNSMPINIYMLTSSCKRKKLI